MSKNKASHRNFVDEMTEKEEKLNDEKEILKLSRQIDERLEQKADAHNLTAVNVKSILTHLIKNDQVLTMLRSSMNEENNLNLQYGLKLTRRKTKELVEKGQEIHWPLSPVKFDVPTTAPITFLDLDYDTEEDDDYDPSKEIESAKSSDLEDVADETDDETAAFINCQPSCSKNLPFDDDLLLSSSKMFKEPSILFDVSRPSPTLSSPISNRMKRKLSRGQGSPSYATRSKKSLCGIPIEQLEAPLFDIRPDFDFDLTPRNETDEDYVNFLSSAIAGNLNQAENKDDDDSNDPEYNFLDDQEIIDGDEMRRDKATKVSKKELHGLLSDLLDIFNEEDSADDTLVDDDESNLPSASNAVDISPYDDDGHRPSGRVEIKNNAEVVVYIDKSGCDDKSGQISNDADANTDVIDDVDVAYLIAGDETTEFSATLLADDRSFPLFLESEVEQLKEQMRQHVQLLTQTFLLSKCSSASDELKNEQNISVQCLNELNVASTKTNVGERSFFNIYNLPLSLTILNDCWNLNLIRPTVKPNLRPANVLPREIRNVIANSKCFLYSNLLPKRPPLDDFKEKKRLPAFFPSEDLLLTLGYLQFHHLKNINVICKLTRENCLPVRTMDTLRNRIAKLCAVSHSDNILKDARLENIYPNLIRRTSPFDPSTVMEPRSLPYNQMPKWLMEFTSEKRSKNIPKHLNFKKRKFNQLTKFETNRMTGFLMDKNGRMYQVVYDADQPSAAASLKFKLPLDNPQPTVVDQPPSVETRRDGDVGCSAPVAYDDDCMQISSPPRSPSPSMIYVNIGTPTSQCGDDQCADELDANTKSPSPTFPTDSKNKHRTKRIRTHRVENFLKTILTFDGQTEENLAEVLAVVFLKALRGGLFMHQSQLQRFFDVVRRSPVDGDTTKVFENLIRILSERPTPHKNLCELLTMFMQAHQASTFGCYQLYRNQRSALQAISKLERYVGTQKHKSLLKNLFRRIKNDDVDEEKLCDELRQIVGSESLILWDHLKQLFDRECVGKTNYDDDAFEFIDQCTLNRVADEFENVSLDVNFENESTTGQRLCACVCHKNDVVTHCNSCKIKFCDGKVFICKTGRWFVPGTLELGGVVSFGEPSTSTTNVERSKISDGDSLEETPLISANLEENENIRRFMNLIDAFENESPTRDFESDAKRSRIDVGFCPDDRIRHGSKKIRADDDNSLSSSIFLRGSEGRHVMLERADELRSTENSVAETCHKYPTAGTASSDEMEHSSSFQNEIHCDLSSASSSSTSAVADVWTENYDRCLLEELKTYGVFDDACRSAAKKLRIEDFLVRNNSRLKIGCNF